MLVNEFLAIIKKAFGTYGLPYGNEEEYVILEYLDFVKPEDVLERRTAAQMIHCILLKILKENDEPDITPAFELKDIFECKVCLPHIAQVYVKGIMPAKRTGSVGGELVSTESLFGVREVLLREEADDIIRKTFNKTVRVIPETFSGSGTPKVLTHEGFEKLLETNPDTLLIDIDMVRSEEKGYLLKEKSINGKLPPVCHIPMTEIIRNPYCIREKIEKIAGQGIQDLNHPVVILGSEDGCSLSVAECLTAAGYRNIFLKKVVDK